MNNTILITKLSTTNIGNQALSEEVIRLYEKDPRHLCVLGRPAGLFGYSIEKLRKSRNPKATFERWADNLILKLGRSGGAFISGTGRVQLLSFGDFKVKNDNLFQGIKSIFRKCIHIETIFAYAYKKRFLKICSADSIIYSGAGEVGDNNIFLRQLLELRIAQKLGKKTYAINQSVEVVESPIKEICGAVYKKMARIVVRGEVSRSKLISLGLTAEQVECYPDSAFLSRTPSAALTESMKQSFQINKPAVGINATNAATDIKGWKEIIDLLRLLGYNLYFISNDPFRDRIIGEQFVAQFGIVFINEFMNYPRYAALMANFEFVISCRLHTNELSLTAGTPVIPIEGSYFKTKEVFSLIRYPISVTNASSPNWADEVKKHVYLFSKTSKEVQDFILNLDEVRSLSQHNYLK